MTCQKASLLPILSAVRKIILLVQIIVPILLIVWGIISFIQLMQNPEQKDGMKKVFNRLLAAVIVFFIPIFINVIMGLLGESTNFSSCWENAKDYKVVYSGYSEIDGHKRKPIVSKSK